MFQGKRIFFSLTVLGAKLFISAMSMAITSVPGNGKVTFSRELREEISHWRFVDLWPGFLPRRDEKHLCFSLSADADTPHRVTVPLGIIGMRLNISSKEMLALFNGPGGHLILELLCGC